VAQLASIAFTLQYFQMVTDYRGHSQTLMPRQKGILKHVHHRSADTGWPTKNKKIKHATPDSEAYGLGCIRNYTQNVLMYCIHWL